MRVAIAAIALLALAACGSNEQSRTGGQRTAAGHSYDAAQNAYVVPGWKSGDAESWEQQLRARAQQQNEYTRVSP